MLSRFARNVCIGIVLGATAGGIVLSTADTATAVPPCLSNCLTSHSGVGCDDASCESLICSIDPFCCNIAWDGICAREARDYCGLPGLQEVSVDIKPGSCPNPVNLQSNGVVSVAIVSTVDFDATTVDPSTVTLAGVVPVRASIEDVATPYIATSVTGGPGDCVDPHTSGGCSNIACQDLVCSTVDPFCCFFNWDSNCAAAAAALCVFDASCTDCTDEGPDGFDDAVLKFDRQELAAVIGAAPDGMCLELTLEGCTVDGIPFSGVDRIRIINN